MPIFQIHRIKSRVIAPENTIAAPLTHHATRVAGRWVARSLDNVASNNIDFGPLQIIGRIKGRTP